MKKLACILVGLLFVCTLHANHYALVIGIGNYPDVDYGWRTIHGNNDIPIVCEMLMANGFPKENITILRDSQATYDAILAAFAELESKLSKADVVYIHFSGHGQRITDKNGDEFDGFDEAWIPYDALMEATPYYNGEKHLIDDKINKLLWSLRKKIGKQGKIVAVTDACHSGTATRHCIAPKNPDIVRGTETGFYLDSAKEDYEEYEEKEERKYYRLETKIMWYIRLFGEEAFLKRTTEHPTEWISIAACADNEQNRQIKLADGSRYGSLSYALYSLRNELWHLTLKELRTKLKEEVDRFVLRRQNPQINFDGDENQYLFR